MYRFVLRFTALSQGFTFRDFTSCSRVKKHFVKSIDLYLDLDLQICVKVDYRKELFPQIFRDVTSGSGVRKYFAKSIAS